MSMPPEGPPMGLPEDAQDLRLAPNPGEDWATYLARAKEHQPDSLSPGDRVDNIAKISMGAQS